LWRKFGNGDEAPVILSCKSNCIIFIHLDCSTQNQ
jgi:hypothetical protein